MATIPKQQLDEILANAPTGTTPAGIVKALQDQGYTIEGYSTEEPTTAQSVGNFLGGAVYGFSATGRTIQNTLSKGAEMLGAREGFGQATREGFEQSTGTDLDSGAGRAGNLVGEVAPYVMQPSKGFAKGAQGIAQRFGLDTAVGTTQECDLKEGATIGAG